MNTWEQFREELRNAVAHLFDPDYQPSELMYAVTGCGPQDGAGPVQSAIIQVIEDLAEAQDSAQGVRARRMVDLLHKRFVLRQTQHEAAERLGLSVRHLRRAQREATHMLARLLWEHSLAREAPGVGSVVGRGDQPPTPEAVGVQPLDWRAQVKQELASLQTSAPGAVADVAKTVREAVEMESVLASRHGVTLSVREMAPDLIVAIHPSALRQILIVAIGQVVHDSSSGQIDIYAEREGGDVRITVRGPASETRQPPNGDLIEEILAPHGGSVEVGLEGDDAFLRIRVPAIGTVTVLVVEDNLDLVHFYRRCTAGTRYHIVHEATGQGVFDAAKAVSPKVIVLDVMLPDVDGWKLLAHLHEHPATRSIPVIVCSVIREVELALALGAALHLAKPVHANQFREALGHVLRQTPGEATRAPESSVTAC